MARPNPNLAPEQLNPPEPSPPPKKGPSTSPKRQRRPTWTRDESGLCLGSSIASGSSSCANRYRLEVIDRRVTSAFVERSGSLLACAIEPEFPFGVTLGGARIRGRVDLLARAEGGGDRDVVLVDFKTRGPSAARGAPEPAPPACRGLSCHRLQPERSGDLEVNGSGPSPVNDDPNRARGVPDEPRTLGRRHPARLVQSLL